MKSLAADFLSRFRLRLFFIGLLIALSARVSIGEGTTAGMRMACIDVGKYGADRRGWAHTEQQPPDITQNQEQCRSCEPLKSTI